MKKNIKKIWLCFNLDDNFRVTADAMNFTLERAGVNEKTGKLKWDVLGYYTALQILLKDYSKHLMRQGGAIPNVEGMLDLLSEINEKIESACLLTHRECREVLGIKEVR